MNHSTTVRPRLRAGIAVLLTALFVVTGLSVGTSTAQAATGDVAGATLHWGIKESFRSYIAGPIANGSTELSGGVTGAFDWSSGAGSADEAADTGAVAYPGSIHFLGHGGALDLTFSNVRVQQSSSTSADIVLDTATASNVVFATVDLASATSTTTVGTVAYSGAPAVLTAAGATSFAGFYSEGTALDPVTFSWPVEQAPVVEPPAPAVPTITVSKTSDISPAGEVVTVTGTGFLPSGTATNGTRPPLANQFSGAYVAFGKFATVWQPSTGAASSTRVTSPTATKWAVNAADVATVGGANRGAIALDANGGFTVQLTIGKGFTGEPATGNYGIYTYSGSGGNYAPFETYTPITFTPAAGTSVAVTATAAVEGGTSTLAATVTPAAPGTITFSDGTTVLGTVPSTAATVTTAALAAGTHTFTAQFTPTNPLLFAAGSGTVALDVAAKPVAAGSLTWGVKQSFREYIVGGIARGSISTTGVGTVGGRFVFAQSTGGTFSPTAGTGSVNYAGSVRFYGHNGSLDVTIANPVITVESASRATLYVTANGSFIAIATLDLSSGNRSTPGNAVAYSGVPATLTAAGSSLFSYQGSTFYPAGTAIDPVSFVLGSAGTAAAGGIRTIAAFAGEPEPAATPPATTGIEVELESLKNLVAGGEVTITASGFTPGETGIMIVIYSDPVVLARDLVADASGSVTWTGRLPAALTGTHTLTMQGSVARGVVLDIPAELATAAVGCPVDGAELTWGFKESFRSYISGSIANGEWTVADGATYATPDFGWSDGTGAYDPEGGLVAFDGSIRFTGHGGVLDTTVANPQLTFLDEDTAVILLDVSGTTQDGAEVNSPAVEFVELDLSGATVELKDDTLTVTGAPATLTTAGAEAFGTYPAGEEFDAVSLTLPLETNCANGIAPVDEATTADPAVTSSSADLWWILWLVLALVVVAAIVTVILVRRRNSAA